MTDAAVALAAHDVRTDIAHLLQCTLQIQSLIEQGNWLAAAELDVERQQRLQQCCARLEPRSCPPDVLAVLGEMVRLNDALIGFVEQRQDQILRDSRAIGLGRRAVAAYSAT